MMSEFAFDLIPTAGSVINDLSTTIRADWLIEPTGSTHYTFYVFAAFKYFYRLDCISVIIENRSVRK